MVFSSISFLYFFLPILLLIYFSVPTTARNPVLLVCSLFFYFVGEPIYICLLLFSSILDYSLGRLIEKYREKGWARLFMLLSVTLNLGLLGVFKYADFFIENINLLLKTALTSPGWALPLGISFYTFQTMSYTIDVYRGQIRAQKNFLDFATYVCLFPQLVAGPIVRYQTVSAELKSRKVTAEDFAYGANRFVIGLGKKVLLANPLGEWSGIAYGADSPTLLFYWMGAVSFMLQIYFDFSGYSDMAIGLGRMLGFHFLENFNYPFIAQSVTDFWRRWHISLGSFIRDYLYVPLGGNRVSTLKQIRNVVLVWFLTGFWHGAGWNFIYWGLYFAGMLLLEKFVLCHVLEKCPGSLRHIYLFFVLIISFVIFGTEEPRLISMRLLGMFGAGDIPLWNQASLYYLRSYGCLLFVAVIGVTPILSGLGKKLHPVLLVLLLLLSTAYIVDSSFNPFLYFRF